MGLQTHIHTNSYGFTHIHTQTAMGLQIHTHSYGFTYIYVTYIYIYIYGYGFTYKVSLQRIQMYTLNNILYVSNNIYTHKYFHVKRDTEMRKAEQQRRP